MIARTRNTHRRERADNHGDWVLAGAVGGVVGGLPSTVHAASTRRDLLQSTRAAGTLLLSDSRRPASLLGAGSVVHAGLSLGWAAVLSRMLPRRAGALRRSASAAVAAVAIAALDLGVVGRHYPAIRALPYWPQVADHVVYAETVAWVLAARRRRANVGVINR